MIKFIGVRDTVDGWSFGLQYFERRLTTPTSSADRTLLIPRRTA
jgi:hypothetical protein